MNAMELGADLSISGQYVVLKKDVTPQVKRTIDDLNLGGIVWGELSSERLYPDGELMGSLLGGVNDKGVGVAGFEQMENKNAHRHRWTPDLPAWQLRWRRDSRHHDRSRGRQGRQRRYADH